VGLHGHFQAAVYALQFHSGHQQKFGARRRSNFDRLPPTSVRRTSTNIGAKHRNQLVRRRLAMTVHATQRLRSLALAARSRCSSKRELLLVHWRPISTDADCLYRRHRFGARYSDETLVKW